MKKKVLLMLPCIVAVSAIGGVKTVKSIQVSNKTTVAALLSNNVESMSFCEITKGGKVRLKCTGAGTCSTTYMGYTLTCDGKKCN